VHVRLPRLVDDDCRRYNSSTGNNDMPANVPHIRIETGVRQGDEISVYYDPMISKLVVWDKDRNSALRRLRLALGQYQVVGPSTNIEFLKSLSSHEEFDRGNVHTGFIEDHYDELFPCVQVPDASFVLQAAMAMILRES